MKRREFIKYGSAGIVTLSTIGGLGLRTAKARKKNSLNISFSIIGADVEMVDGTPVYMWCFDDGINGPRTPGPVIEAFEGDAINISVTNNSIEDHEFAIHGTPPPVITTGIINPGQTKTLQFTAPIAGTYMYLDPLNAPVNRVLGLHGALAVLPTSGNTPYSNPTPRVQLLFDDLGNAAKGFPGDAWDKKSVFPNGRTWVWVFDDVDPQWNAMADNGIPIDANDFVANFLPRYFLINGQSGWYMVQNKNTAPHAKEGEPSLIRTMMAGMGTRPPHIHGNHVYQLSDMDSNGQIEVLQNVVECDTWALKPMHTIDVLLPFRRPPDIPMGLWPSQDEAYPYAYIMHPHDEICLTAGGGSYPQGMMNDWVMEEPRFPDPGNTLSFNTQNIGISFEQFACKPLRISPPTPDQITPDVFIKREFFDSSKITMPDGNDVEFWGFEDPDDPSTKGSVPSPLIRVREGQILHCELKPKKNTHTIHWHGLEPSTHNDGVPHTSFEVNSRYTYQLQPNQAGTYFYHCHKNTVLHFQMGMFGLMIVDPPTGPGRLCTGGPKYDKEMILAFADVDPDWRDLSGGHDAGMCGNDVGLNDFNPKYFMINGVPHPNTLSDSKVVVNATEGDDVLFRILNASYSINFITIPFDVGIVEVDGRPLLPTPSNYGYSKWYIWPGGKPMELETAQRHSALVRNIPAGTYKISCEYRHLIRPNQVLGIAETYLVVSPKVNETINVTLAAYSPSRKGWGIDGNTTIPGPGNTMTFYVGNTLNGPVIGTKSVDSSGNWRFRKGNSPLVPDSTNTISVQSSNGTTVLGVPLTFVP
ncbi:MAG: multicopper oxidase domain-containing protein [bacterium]